MNGILRVLALSAFAASAMLGAAPTTVLAQPASYDRQPANNATLKKCLRYHVLPNKQGVCISTHF